MKKSNLDVLVETEQQILHSIKLDRELERKQANQLIAQQEAQFWANTISFAYSVAAWSFNTARWDDVKKDVDARKRLTHDDVKIILTKMLDLGAIEQVHAEIWHERITGQKLN